MELLNPAFIILLIKITIVVLPGAIGIYFLSMSEEKKRSLRKDLCNRVFGVSNAISLPTFERSIWIVGILGILVCLAAAWFLLISNML